MEMLQSNPPQSQYIQSCLLNIIAGIRLLPPETATIVNSLRNYPNTYKNISPNNFTKDSDLK